MSRNHPTFTTLQGAWREAEPTAYIVTVPLICILLFFISLSTSFTIITVNNLKICLNSLISYEICFCNVLVFVIFFCRVVYCSVMLVTKATICSVMYLQCLQHRLVRISLLITLRGLKVKGAESQQSSSFCQYSGTLIYRANLYITKSSI